jgi:hypothetical protein
MQITETLNEGLKRAYQITITGDDLETRVSEKLEEARPEIEMKGFRKGKVPMALLKKQFGPRLMGEAMQEAVDGAMQGHLDETGDRPAMQPEVKMVNEDWKEGDDVVVSMSYEKAAGDPGCRLQVDQAGAPDRRPRRCRYRRGAGQPRRERAELRHQEGRQGRRWRPGRDRLQGHAGRRGLRRRHGGGLPAGAGLQLLHPRLRGTADRRQEGRGEVST